MGTSFLDPVFNPILQPLLDASPFWAIVILAVVISVIIVLVYKYATDQTEMHRLKDEQKNFHKRMKELKSQPEEMMKVQKEAMKLNMEYMKKSFKPTLITMIPIILILGWMAAHLSYEPIYPNESYSVTAYFSESLGGKEALLEVDDKTKLASEAAQQINPASRSVTWNLKTVTEGEHFITAKVGDDEQVKKVLVTTELKYVDPISTFEHSDIEKIEINYNQLRPLGQLSLFGWKPGWLGLYIIFSLIVSLALRKVLKIA